MNVPRRSDCTNRVSRKIFKWCEIVGCPIGKCFTMSHTHTAPRFAASKFKIRIRVGSASALNHPAYSRARPRLSFGPASVRQQSPLPFAQSVVQFVFCAIESVASQFLAHLSLLHSSTNVNEWLSELIRMREQLSLCVKLKPPANLRIHCEDGTIFRDESCCPVLCIG